MSDAENSIQGAESSASVTEEDANVTAEEKAYTDSLGDGSQTGNATEDPSQDSDTASGGDVDGESA